MASSLLEAHRLDEKERKLTLTRNWGLSMPYPTPSSPSPVRGNPHHPHFMDALTAQYGNVMHSQEVNKSVDPKVVPLPCNFTQPVYFTGKLWYRDWLAR